MDENDDRKTWTFGFTVLADTEAAGALELYNRLADLVMDFGEVQSASFNLYGNNY